MSDDFNELVDSALLAADEAPPGWFNLSAFFRNNSPDIPINAINDVRSRLAYLGFGLTYTDREAPYGRFFKINSTGRSRAASIRNDQQAGLADRGNVNIQNNITVNPVINNTATSPNSGRPSHGAAWFGAWGQWVGAIAAILAILVTLKLAGII